MRYTVKIVKICNKFVKIIHKIEYSNKKKKNVQYIHLQ